MTEEKFEEIREVGLLREIRSQFDNGTLVSGVSVVDTPNGVVEWQYLDYYKSWPFLLES